MTVSQINTLFNHVKTEKKFFQKILEGFYSKCFSAQYEDRTNGALSTMRNPF